MKLEPLVFEEDFHPALWGGEHWLVSVHRKAPSKVKGGRFAGCRLDELVAEFGEALVGRRVHGGFPLLLKVIDARTRLSVQVHPNEVTAAITGGEPKSEMWHVLSSAPGGAVYAGFLPGITHDKLAAATKNGKFEDVVQRYTVEPGRGMFIPGGLIHSIGEGVRIFEVQQSSDTTFRLYDWGRKGADGKPRALQVVEALAAVDLAARPELANGEFRCQFFSLVPRALAAVEVLPPSLDAFKVFFAEKGAFAVESAENRLEISTGGVVLIPASVPVKLIPADAEVRLLEVSV